MPNRVVVTGVGCVSAVGHSLDAVWQAALDGRTGIKAIELFDTTEFDVHFAAEISDWDPDQFMDPKVAKRCDRFVQFALAASYQAMADADFSIGAQNAADVGCVIGSGIGGMWTWERQHKILLERGPSRVSPFLIPMLISDMASGMVSMQTGARGPNYGLVSACASSTHALGDSFEIIRRGAAQAMIAGGSEATISPIGLAGFCSAKALSTRNDDPATACRPFDRTRDGFVMGEGACVMILESLDHAQARGARIYAEILGFGASGDAYNMVAPEPSGVGAVIAMNAALDEAGLSPRDIDYVNCHAPGTPGGDDMETRALQTIYTPDYSPAVNSTKPIHGHQLGATGATELGLCFKSMAESLIPATLNCTAPDDDIWLDIVRGEHRSKHVGTVMNNSFGFGGHNAVIVAREYEG
jgi:3-oxoacyl-[acyl-carrier-protein] synthase II